MSGSNLTITVDGHSDTVNLSGVRTFRGTLTINPNSSMPVLWFRGYSFRYSKLSEPFDLIDYGSAQIISFGRYAGDKDEILVTSGSGEIYVSYNWAQTTKRACYSTSRSFNGMQLNPTYSYISFSGVGTGYINIPCTLEYAGFPSTMIYDYKVRANRPSYRNCYWYPVLLSIYIYGGYLNRINLYSPQNEPIYLTSQNGSDFEIEFDTDTNLFGLHVNTYQSITISKTAPSKYDFSWPS